MEKRRPRRVTRKPLALSSGKPKQGTRETLPATTRPQPKPQPQQPTSVLTSKLDDDDSKVDIDIAALPDIRPSRPSKQSRGTAKKLPLPNQNMAVKPPQLKAQTNPVPILDEPSEEDIPRQVGNTLRLPAKVVRNTNPVNEAAYEERNIPWPKPVKLGTGPLSGIRILDMTRMYTGPMATMMLADMGADVIKIEDLISPDYMRDTAPYVNDISVGYLAVNRSKRSLGLRLSEEKGQAIFFDLVKTADIVIEQYKPGVLEKIGLDYVEAIKTNPRIIYVSLTDFGQEGPYAQKTGHDVNILGLSGILSNTITDKGEPVVPGVQIADVAGSYMAMNACLAALLARDRTGQGQRVDVSRLDATLPFMSLPLAHYWATGEGLAPSQQPQTEGMAAYGTYRCRDGKYVALGVVEPKFWTRFCELAGKPKWLNRQYATGRDATKLRKEIVSLFKSKPRDYWIEQIGQGDYCLTPVLDVSEVEADVHLSSRHMIDSREHKGYGTVKSVGIPLKFSQTKPRIGSSAPDFGQHSDEVLMELGYSDSKITELRRLGIIPKKK